MDEPSASNDQGGMVSNVRSSPSGMLSGNALSLLWARSLTGISSIQAPPGLCSTCVNSTSNHPYNAVSHFGLFRHMDSQGFHKFFERYDGTWRNNVTLGPWCWFPHHANFRSLARSANEGGCKLCRVFYEAILHHSMNTKNYSREEAEQFEILQDEEIGADDVDLSSPQNSEDWSGPGMDGVERTGHAFCPIFKVILGEALRPKFGVALWYTMCDGDTTDVNPRNCRDHLTYSRGLKSGSEQRRHLPEVSLCSLSGQNNFVVGRLVPREVDIEIAIDWMQKCAAKHPKCGRITDKPLPTRLIEIGEQEGSDVHLSLTHGQSGKYVTLSHRWGDDKTSFFTTTRDNLQQHMRGISFSVMPKLFQDAVTVTRRLGFRYLWIDCLCIIQEREDWEVECSKMSQVYQNSVITIAAPGAATNQGTMLHPRPEPVVEPVVFGSDPDLVVLVPQTAGIASSLDRREHRDQLSSRGWILQERLLSPRVLYFGTRQMYFECRTHECFENIWHSIAPAYKGREDDVNKPPLHEFQYPGDPLWTKHSNTFGELSGNPYESLYEMWQSIVERYCKCTLTKPQDKLPALSGLAQNFAQVTGATYAAGIWKEDLLASLHWLVLEPSSSRKDVEDLWLGPSWSWSSAHGAIVFNNQLTRESMFTVQKHYITTQGQDRFGTVKSGSLQIRTRIKILTVHRFKDTGDYCLLYRRCCRRVLIADYFPDFDQSALHGKRVNVILIGSQHGEPRPIVFPMVSGLPGSFIDQWSALVIEKILSSSSRSPKWRRIGFASTIRVDKSGVDVWKRSKTKDVELL